MEKSLVSICCTLLITAAIFPMMAIGQSIPNNPPEIPMIMGPTEGSAGIAYEYLISSWDPDGDDISYWVEWGDGTHTGWIGPYPSGEHAAANHTWAERGSYSITAKAKDVNNAESNFSAPLIMNTTGYQIEITLRPRGLGVAATILNVGEDAATHVTWTITLNGGIILYGKSKNSTIDEILPGGTVLISSFFFGFLKSNVTATADNSSDALGGFLAGPFLLAAVVNELYSGTVQKIDTTKKEITVKNDKGAIKTFKIDPACKFKDKNGNAINLNQIQPDDTVKVTWQRQGAPNAEKVAVEIQRTNR
jgi:hypothetical protein